MTAEWVPDACTLPTEERPVRVAEFDTLFREGLRSQTRISATVLHWEFEPAALPSARRLAALESGCCTFVTFAFDGSGVDVTVPAAHRDVLDALAARAAR
jgi:hypothetical protein